jgi:tRNA(Ile)-lysidine synthase
MGRLALRDHLRAERLVWIEDPSNTDPRYARVRIREALARSPSEADRLIDEACLAADGACALHWHAQFAVDHHFFPEGGEGVIYARLLEEEAGWKALSAIATAAGGRLREPPSEAARGFARRLADDGATAFAGAVFRRRRHLIHFRRDAGGVMGRRGGAGPHPPLRLEPQTPAVWDRRLELLAQEPGWMAAPTPLGRSANPGFSREGERCDPGDAVARHWLLRERVATLLWRARPPSFQ